MMMSWFRDMDASGRRTFWACFGGYALDAMDVHLYAFVAPVLILLWGMSNAEAGILASVTLIASSLGGWAAGLLADRIGRIRTLQITVLWFSFFAFLSGLTWDFGSLAVTRGLQGLGFGGEWTTSAVLMAEVVTPQVRGRALGFIQSAWAIGWACAAITATTLLSVLPPEIAWRAVFLAGLVPAAFVLVIRGRIPESALFRQARHTAPVSPYAIFSAPYSGATVRATFLAFGAHGGYYSLTTWLPLLLRTERGMTIIASGSYYLTLAAGSLLGYWTGAFASDALGRRPTFILAATGAIACVLVATTAPLTAGQMIAFAFPLGFCASSIYAGLGAQFAELYPTPIRGSGQGFCFNAGRGFAAMFPALVGFASVDNGLSLSIGLLASLAFGFVIVAALLLPETNGRALRTGLGGENDT
ncbi:MFS transporter [Sphingomonas arantia]|uniref:MFS transporter n=1 Tax=Sphingomonas arantia TaxID=1460676 RepID=A0ABW4U0F0_9SPHN